MEPLHLFEVFRVAGDYLFHGVHVIADGGHLRRDQIEAVIKTGLTLVETLAELGHPLVGAVSILPNFAEAFIDMLTERSELVVKELVELFE